jgi:spore maturation protein CgeB
LLSEYSDDLAALYQQGTEADFFKSRDEMMEKIKLYVENEFSRQRVAKGGYDKVLSAGHDIDTRMRFMLGWIAEISKTRGG